MDDRLKSAMVNLQEDEAIQIAKEYLAQGENPLEIMEICQKAMKIVGEKYQKQEYYLPELIMSGEMLRNISDAIKPEIAGTQKSHAEKDTKRGKIVIGTVRGDIHDIGKNIVGLMLDVNGFEVHDLGVDVPEEKFVEAVRTIKPQIVALSGLLTLTYDVMKSTIEAIKAAGLGDHVKVMIGGGQVNDQVREYTGADAYGKDPIEAVRLAEEWIP